MTQGATPIHVYSGVTITSNGNGGYCITPGTEIYNSKQTVTLGSYSSGTVNLAVSPNTTGFVYVAIHLDFGLKGTMGWNKDASSSSPAYPKAVNSAYPLISPLQNGRGYTFGFTNGTSDSQTVTSMNTFKKNPGIGGVTLKSASGDPVAGAKVQVYDSNKKLLGTVYTDQDGYYMWAYKYTGKAASFTVKLPDLGKSQTVTLKSNGFLEVNFTNLP